MGALRSLAHFAKNRSRRLLFLLIAFQLPLFRSGCRTGTCETPLHVMLGGVEASFTLPPNVLSALLFPGALLRNAVHSFETGVKFETPSLSIVLGEFNFTEEQESIPPGQHFRLEIVIASYLMVAGSVQALFQPGRLAFLGSLLTGWAWVRARLPDQESEAARPEIYPTFYLFFILSFLALPLVEKGVKRKREAVPSQIRPKTE